MFSQYCPCSPRLFLPSKESLGGEPSPAATRGLQAGWEGVIPRVSRAGWRERGGGRAARHLPCPLPLSPGISLPVMSPGHTGTQIHSVTHPQGIVPARTMVPARFLGSGVGHSPAPSPAPPTAT